MAKIRIISLEKIKKKKIETSRNKNVFFKFN
jgi:hypothetical protein